MFGLETIKTMNKEKTKIAKDTKTEPYIIERETEKQNYPPFPFPNIGDYVPEGWEEVNTYFVDSSGVGTSDELALTTETFIEKLKVGYGYAITEVGQFQVYVGEFKKVKQWEKYTKN